ncbi:MAG: sensor histidine kinase, partial [Ruminococcus sp.]|nr:sensor histidine kinase [Ruminococcus sp.]
MRAFGKLCIAVLALFLVLAAVLNIVILKGLRYTDGQYRVEAKRLADEITETGSYDLTKYPHITGVYAGE